MLKSLIKRINVLQIINNNFFMLQYIKRYCKRHIAVTLFSGIIGSLSPVINLLITRYIINAITSSESSPYLLMNVIAFVVLMIVYNIMIYLINSHIVNIVIPKHTQIIYQKMQMELFRKAIELDYESYEDVDFYNKFSMAMLQSDQRALAVLNTFTGLISSFFGLGTLLALISVYDPAVIIVVLLNVAVSFVVSAKSIKTQHDYAKERIPMQREQEYVKRIVYFRDFAKELRLFPSLEKIIEDKLNTSVNSLSEMINRYGHKLALFSDLQGGINAVANGGITIYLAKNVIYHSLVIGDFVTVLSGSQQLSAQISNFLKTIPQMYEHNLYVESFKEFINYELNNASNGSINIKTINKLRMENISFTYSKNNKKALQNINLEISAGERIAIVGRNGAGKSTLIKLIARLYEPDCGCVFVNDVKSQDFKRDDYRKNIGIVFQDYMIFSFTIAENILMRPISSRESDEQLIIESLKFAGLYDKVIANPSGIYAPISREFSSDGIFLSGGEMQKLALARVYARNCSLIILDEPSSALDIISEKEMFARMKVLSNKKCAIMVSHRIENIMDADRIYVMEQGRIVESGTHSQLIDKCGCYYDMYVHHMNGETKNILTSKMK